MRVDSESGAMHSNARMPSLTAMSDETWIAYLMNTRLQNNVFTSKSTPQDACQDSLAWRQRYMRSSLCRCFEMAIQHTHTRLNVSNRTREHGIFVRTLRRCVTDAGPSQPPMWCQSSRCETSSRPVHWINFQCIVKCAGRADHADVANPCEELASHHVCWNIATLAATHII